MQKKKKDLKKRRLTVVKHSVVVRGNLNQGQFLLSNVCHAVLSPGGGEKKHTVQNSNNLQLHKLTAELIDL